MTAIPIPSYAERLAPNVPLWDDIHFHDIVLKVPACPLWTVDTALKRATREFLRDSLCWRSENLLLCTTEPGTRVYAIENRPSSASLERVLSAWSDGKEVDVELPGEREDYDHTQPEDLCTIGVDGYASVYVSPTPNIARKITGTVAWVTAPTALEPPPRIWEDWRQEISHGAVYFLKMDTNKAWSDPIGARYFMDCFEQGKTLASNRAGVVRRKPIRTKKW
jgi:hypothetical protein